MKIGIGIPCLNLWSKYTKPMLASVKSSHDPYFVLVDNGSTDETYAEATKMINDNFHYRRNETNWGVSKSWNYAMNDCFVNRGCDYVLICNNDILLHPEAVDRLVSRLEKKDDGLVMVTCHNAIDDFGRDPKRFFDADVKPYENLYENEHPDYSCFMVNRKYFDEVGEFDEGFTPAFYEDNDSHRRLKLAGLRAIKVPSALHFHWGSRTQFEAVEGKTLVMSHNSHVYFIRKWGGDPNNDNPGTDKLFPHPFNDEAKGWKWTQQCG